MYISDTTQVKAPKEKIWNMLSSFDNVEKYLSIVTKSVVEGSGHGSKRTCDVNMGRQIFQIQETLETLDNPNYILTTSLDEGPIQMRGMKFIYNVKNNGKNFSDVTISTRVENPDAAVMAKNFFALIGQGLKKYYDV
jgi:carbon monoxide dehydrogenase subunit G